MNLLAFIIDQFSEDDDCHSLVVGRLAGYLAKEAGIPPTQCLKQKSLDFCTTLAVSIELHRTPLSIFGKYFSPLKE